MKRNMLHSSVLLSIAFACSSIYSQVTITKDDLARYFAPGKTITSYMYTETIDVNIGIAGGGNTWDFSFLNSKKISSTLTVQNPSTTPFSSDFPGANLAFYVTSLVVEDSPEAFSPDIWLYNVLGNDLSTLGNGGKSKVMGLDVASRTYNKPAYIQMKLPAAYGQTWTQKYSDSTVNNVGGISSYTTGTTTVITTVDAYGVLKMPGGYSVDALRIKRDMDGYLTSQYGQQSRRRVMEYVFQGKNGEVVNVSAQDLTPPPGGILRTSGIIWTQSNTNDVPGRAVVANNFTLSPNYPNPFNPETIVEYSLPEETFVDIKVYDALGKEVSLLVSKTEKPGSYKISFNGSHLPGGIYFLHMKAGNFNAVRKMALIK